MITIICDVCGKRVDTKPTDLRSIEFPNGWLPVRNSVVRDRNGQNDKCPPSIGCSKECRMVLFRELNPEVYCIELACVKYEGQPCSCQICTLPRPDPRHFWERERSLDLKTEPFDDKAWSAWNALWDGFQGSGHGAEWMITLATMLREEGPQSRGMMSFWDNCKRAGRPYWKGYDR